MGSFFSHFCNFLYFHILYALFSYKKKTEKNVFVALVPIFLLNSRPTDDETDKNNLSDCIYLIYLTSRPPALLSLSIDPNHFYQ